MIKLTQILIEVIILKKLYILLITLLFTSSCGLINPASPKEDELMIMTAKITNITDIIEVEVISSQNAYGTYWLIADNAIITDKDDNPKKLSDLNIASTIEVYYLDQVMLSYPPRIIVYKIII